MQSEDPTTSPDEARPREPHRLSYRERTGQPLRLGIRDVFAPGETLNAVDLAERLDTRRGTIDACIPKMLRDGQLHVAAPWRPHPLTAARYAPGPVPPRPQYPWGEAEDATVLAALAEKSSVSISQLQGRLGRDHFTRAQVFLRLMTLAQSGAVHRTNHAGWALGEHTAAEVELLGAVGIRADNPGLCLKDRILFCFAPGERLMAVDLRARTRGGIPVLHTINDLIKSGQLKVVEVIPPNGQRRAYGKVVVRTSQGPMIMRPRPGRNAVVLGIFADGKVHDEAAVVNHFESRLPADAVAQSLRWLVGNDLLREVETGRYQKIVTTETASLSSPTAEQMRAGEPSGNQEPSSNQPAPEPPLATPTGISPPEETQSGTDPDFVASLNAELDRLSEMRRESMDELRTYEEQLVELGRALAEVERRELAVKAAQSAYATTPPGAQL